MNITMEYTSAPKHHNRQKEENNLEHTQKKSKVKSLFSFLLHAAIGIVAYNAYKEYKKED